MGIRVVVAYELGVGVCYFLYVEIGVVLFGPLSSIATSMNRRLLAIVPADRGNSRLDVDATHQVFQRSIIPLH